MDLPKPVPFPQRPGQPDPNAPFLTYGDKTFKSKEDLVAHLTKQESAPAQPQDSDQRFQQMFDRHSQKLMQQIEQRLAGQTSQREEPAPQKPAPPENPYDPDTEPARWATEEVKRAKAEMMEELEQREAQWRSQIDETTRDFQEERLVGKFRRSFETAADRLGIDTDLRPIVESYAAYHPDLQNDLGALDRVVSEIHRSVQSVIDKKLHGARNEMIQKGKGPSAIRGSGPTVPRSNASKVEPGRLDGAFASANRLAHAFPRVTEE
jgi:hypothetical protein